MTIDKEVLRRLVDKSQKEFAEEIRKDASMVPKDKADRAEFLKFISMSKEDREKYLSGESEAVPQEPVPPVGGDGSSSSSKPDSGTAQPEPEAPGDESGQSQDPWYKVFGYEAEDKGVEAHKNLLDLSAKQQAIIDALNAKEGKRGQELKRLKEENEKAMRELETLRKTAAPKIEQPIPPKVPNPADYPERQYDEKYLADFQKFQNELLEYNKNMATYFDSKINQVQEKATVPPVVVPEPDAANGNAQWDAMWDSLGKMQNEYGLQTTVSPKAISDAFAIEQNPNASQVEKARAKAFIATIPPRDIEMYQKIKFVAEAAYDFSSGAPVLSYRSLKGALIDNDLLGEGKLINVSKPAPMTQQEDLAAREAARKQREESVSPVPASVSAASDKPASQAMTPDEITAELRTLAKEYNAALNSGKAQKEAFENSQKFVRYMELRRKAGYVKR